MQAAGKTPEEIKISVSTGRLRARADGWIGETRKQLAEKVRNNFPFNRTFRFRRRPR